MTIFEGLRHYAEGWAVKGTRNFTDEEIGSVANAVVVPSQYGQSVCFILKAGGMTYIPVGKDCSKAVGESVDLNEATLVTLSKSGEADIVRINC